jgi:hypothetical protein
MIARHADEPALQRDSYKIGAHCAVISHGGYSLLRDCCVDVDVEMFPAEKL